MKGRMVSVVLFTTLFVSCGVGTKDGNSTDIEYDGGLFQSGELQTISIEMPDSVWQDILHHPAKKDYHLCTVTIGEERHDSVGIRTKGASSLDDVKCMGSDRYSFTLDLNRYRHGNKFHKLSKLLLNNNIWDATQMKDAIAYDMAHYIGLPAPLTNYAQVMVNGRLQGYYLMVEPVNKHFCKRNYDKKGNIYKPYHNLSYTGDELNGYDDIANEAKVGGGEQSMRRVIEALRSVHTGADIEQHVDVENVMKYMALQTMVVNFDCMTGKNTQNYYLRESDGIINIIPWDYNLAWGGYQNDDEEYEGNSDHNQTGDAVFPEGFVVHRPGENLGESTPDEVSLIVNFPINTPFTGNLDKRTFFMNLLANEEYKKLYYHYLEVLCREYIQGGVYAQTAERIKSEIGGVAGTEPNAFYTNKQFIEGAETLDRVLQLKAKSVLGQIEGTIPSTWETQKAEPEKLVDCRGVNLRKLGGLGY